MIHDSTRSLKFNDLALKLARMGRCPPHGTWHLPALDPSNSIYHHTLYEGTTATPPKGVSTVPNWHDKFFPGNHLIATRHVLHTAEYAALFRPTQATDDLVKVAESPTQTQVANPHRGLVRGDRDIRPGRGAVPNRFLNAAPISSPIARLVMMGICFGRSLASSDTARVW